MKNFSKLNKILVGSGVLSSLCLAGLGTNVFAATPALLNQKTEIYKKESTSGGSYGNFDAKTEINFEAMNSVWLKVTRTASGKTYTGYTNVPKNVTLKDNIKAYQNLKDGQSLWSDAKLTNKIVNIIDYGTMFTVARFTEGDKNNSVAYVKTPDGKIGFLNATYLSSVYIPEDPGEDPEDPEQPGQSEREQKIAQMIALAEKQVGKPYVYGAKGPNSYDCRGLTYYVYKEITGIKLKDSSKTQANDSRGQLITSISALEPGDVLAFTSDDSKSLANVNHVGLYIGDGWMIDASSSKGQVIKHKVFTGNSKEYYTRNFAGARRYSF